MLELKKVHIWIFSLLTYGTLIQCLRSNEKMNTEVPIKIPRPPIFVPHNFMVPTFDFMEDFEKDFKQMKKEMEKEINSFHKNALIPTFFEDYHNKSKQGLIPIHSNEREKDILNLVQKLMQGTRNDLPGMTVIRVDDLNDVSSSIHSSGNSKKDNENSKEKNVSGVLDNLIEYVNQMFALVREFSLANPSTHHFNTTKNIKEFDVEINGHGTIFSIPQDALVSKDDSGLVNITWRSDSSHVNNSLSLRVFRDPNEEIVLQNMRLTIVTGNRINKYVMDQQVPLAKSLEKHTIVKLNKNVGVNFPNTDFFDLVITQKRENFSNHWLTFFIAVLGLITSALILLLSYLVYNKNKTNARKNSISKEPIA